MKFKVKTTNRVVNFKCELDCGGQCCTGATMALPAEVKNVYDKVPLTLTMHVNSLDYILMDERLKKEAPRFMPVLHLREDDDGYIGDLGVFFDFAMGAWESEKSCFLLKDGLCSIHNENKPLKCKLLPIQPLSNEIVMYAAYEQMRDYCPGIKNMTAKDCCVYKNGKLCNKDDIKNLQAYYDLAATTHDFSYKYLQFLSMFEDQVIMTQIKENYEQAVEEGKEFEYALSFEVPFFPTELFLKYLGISVKDYIEKQLAVMERFKEYDPEGFDKSFVKLQYEILLNAREVEKELDKIIALKESDPEAFEKSVLAQKYKIFKANKIFENFGYKE